MRAHQCTNSSVPNEQPATAQPAGHNSAHAPHQVAAQQTALPGHRTTRRTTAAGTADPAKLEFFFRHFQARCRSINAQADGAKLITDLGGSPVAIVDERPGMAPADKAAASSMLVGPPRTDDLGVGRRMG